VITQETLVLGVEPGGMPEGETLESAFAAVAEFAARCAHRYFVKRRVKKRPFGDLRIELSARFGLAHRQFSGVAFTVDGKAEGYAKG
jgi:hypothetical protein